MSEPQDFTIHYIGPSIIRCGPRDFCLEYHEPGLNLSWSGLEDRPGYDGVLYFPTPEFWAAHYPEAAGQRDRIKANIIAWANELASMRGFIAEFLSDEAKIAAAAAAAGPGPDAGPSEAESSARTMAPEESAQWDRMVEDFLARFVVPLANAPRAE